MHYFIAMSILALTVLPALLSLAARAGYTGALLPLRNWELLVFMVGATVAGSWYAFINHRGTETQRIFSVSSVAPWLFLMSAMVSTLTSGADLYQFWSISFMALLVWLMLYSGLARTGINPFPTIIAAIRIATLLNAAMAILQLMGINPFFKPAVGEHFITGFFDNPNRFGAFLAIALPLFFTTETRRSQRTISVPLCLSGVIVGFVVLLSRSTFAILAMLTSILYYLFNYHRDTETRRRFLRASMPLWLILILVSALFTFLYLDPPSRANLLRYQIYKKSVSIALERPILGHGLGQFDKVFNARPPEIKDPPRRVTHAHNEYLELFVEQGLIGLAIVLFPLFLVFKNVGTGLAPVRSGQTQGLSLYKTALQASLIALMVNALGFYPMRVPLIAFTVAVVLAGIQSPQRHRM